MYYICKFEINKHTGRVIYSHCYDLDYARLQSAKNELKKFAGVDAKDILPCVKADSNTLQHFHNEFCDGNAQFAFWTIGKADKGLINETTKYYSEWFIYTTDAQRYLYDEPVTDLKRYRAIVGTYEHGFNPYGK